MHTLNLLNTLAVAIYSFNLGQAKLIFYSLLLVLYLKGVRARGHFLLLALALFR